MIQKPWRLGRLRARTARGPVPSQFWLFQGQVCGLMHGEHVMIIYTYTYNSNKNINNYKIIFIWIVDHIVINHMMNVYHYNIHGSLVMSILQFQKQRLMDYSIEHIMMNTWWRTTDRWNQMMMNVWWTEHGNGWVEHMMDHRLDGASHWGKPWGKPNRTDSHVFVDIGLHIFMYMHVYIYVHTYIHICTCVS